MTGTKNFAQEDHNHNTGSYSNHVPGQTDYSNAALDPDRHRRAFTTDDVPRFVRIGAHRQTGGR